jgi:FkbM family methyltransferase
VRLAIVAPLGLRLVNKVHASLSPALRRRFFYVCIAENWRVDGRWHVDFAGRRIVLPLSREFRDGWVAAIGFHGYDADLHELYSALVRSVVPPRVFFDIGAHYGLHSLRMLIHGVRVVSFEPNPMCHRFFLDCCAANGVTPRLEPVAVGDAPGIAKLAAPERSTWLGTTITRVQAAWSNEAVRTWNVPKVSLDSYVAEHGSIPDLIKIDVEGAEQDVLRGAQCLLKTARPQVIFESWRCSNERRELYTLFHWLEYVIAPVAAGASAAPMTENAFRASMATNFLARPRRSLDEAGV